MARQEDIKFFLAALLVLLLDQITKTVIRNNIKINDTVIIIRNIFSVTHATNTGITFGMLKGYNPLLIWVYVIIIGIILYYYNNIDKKIRIPLALVLGAVISNLVDRALLGAVTDFIKISLWPAFNIADLSASIGVIILVIYFWKKK